MNNWVGILCGFLFSLSGAFRDGFIDRLSYFLCKNLSDRDEQD